MSYPVLSDDFQFAPNPTTLRARKKQEVVERARIKMVWVILNQSGKEFGQFPYNERNRAEACCEFLQHHEQSNDTYRVEPRKVPMEKA